MADTAQAEQRKVFLTNREAEVLSHAVQGISSREIANRLFISKRTVDFHLDNIYRKLGVPNRMQALLEAARHGLISVAVGAAHS